MHNERATNDIEQQSMVNAINERAREGDVGGEGALCREARSCLRVLATDPPAGPEAPTTFRRRHTPHTASVSTT
jgi:hypothetical protein